MYTCVGCTYVCGAYIYITTRGRKEIKSAKVRVRKIRSVQKEREKTRSAKARTQKRERKSAKIKAQKERERVPPAARRSKKTRAQLCISDLCAHGGTTETALMVLSSKN